MKPVKIFTTPGCAYCHQAKGLLDSLEVAFEEIDAVEFPERRVKEVVEPYGHQSVPAIFIGEKFIGGNDALQALHKEGKLLEMLNAE